MSGKSGANAECSRCYKQSISDAACRRNPENVSTIDALSQDIEALWADGEDKAEIGKEPGKQNGIEVKHQQTMSSYTADP
jgi:hypothetical protein